jgi:hypothetical protein
MMMIALIKTSPMDHSQNRPGAILTGNGRDADEAAGEAAGAGEPEPPEPEPPEPEPPEPVEPEPVEPDLVVSAAVTLPS